jgi:hypothetical protein
VVTAGVGLALLAASVLTYAYYASGESAGGTHRASQGSRADQRAPDVVHVTGHRVGDVGPYHLAAEYRPAAGEPTWTSGHMPEGGTPVLSDLFADPITSGLNHPADAPVNNITIATVAPPPGMSAGDYWNSLLAASSACCGDLDYALFPSRFFDGYNSNSFLVGLIEATGGTPSVPLSGFGGLVVASAVQRRRCALRARMFILSIPLYLVGGAAGGGDRELRDAYAEAPVLFFEDADSILSRSQRLPA